MFKQFENSKKIMVWDILIRLFHWSLVAFCLIAFLTEDDFLTIHTYAGYTILLLLVFRLFWGFIGTGYARFSQFLSTPKQAIDYLKDEIAGDANDYLGHNPAGAVMIVGLLSCLFITGFTGMATVATEGSGPLAGTFIAFWSGEVLGEIHELLTSITLLLIILHIVGVIFSSMAQEENLIKSMITGIKYRRNDDSQ